MTSSYQKIAKHYDQFTSLSVFNFYLKFIGKVQGLDVLDLGCGTGALIKHYSSKNRTYGIDISPEMIGIAKIKDKKTKYFVDDIRKFKSEKNFDLILCNYDTINHLNNFKEWSSLFKRISRNLKKDGLFVFDFNTIQGLDYCAKQPFFKKFKNNYLAMQVKKKKDRYLWKINLFLENPRGLFEHHETTIEEKSYPEKLVFSELEKNFIIVKKKNLNNHRIFIKAKKKAV
jgi:ubiquinone/menaquinone biosynthesis C-methylase UbiE